MSALDPELEELFLDQPALADMASHLRASRPTARVDNGFRAQLRAQLMAEAEQRRRRRGRLRLWTRPHPLAWAGGGIAAAMAAAVALTLITSRPHDQSTFVTVSSAVNGQPAVSADVITVSFSRPMDARAVVAGLHIQPATAVLTSWRGNQLLIAPLHHLAPNTPYTVTVDERSARSASGETVRGGVRITFGTAPTPAATPGPVPGLPAPLLDIRNLGPVADAGRVLFGPDGSLLATRGIAPTPDVPVPATPSPTPSPSPDASPSPTASPSPAGTPGPPPSSPEATPTPPAAPPTGSPAALRPLAPALVDLGAGGGVKRLGDPASAAAVSTDGRHLASVVPRGVGADIVVGRPDQAGATSVVARADNTGSDVAWSSPERIVYVSAGQIRSVDLRGAEETVAPVAPGRPVKLSPNGAFAFEGASPGAPSGTLVALATRGSRDLPGSHSVAAFSPDGRTVAWSYGEGVAVSPTDRDEPVGVDLPSAYRGPVTDLAVSNDQSKVAFVTGGSTPQSRSVVVLQVASGRTLAVGGRAAAPVFSAPGDRLGLVVADARGGLTAATAPISAAPAAAVAPVTVPPAAESVLNRFLAAQVSGDAAAITRLSGGDQAIGRRTPRGLSRSNVVDAAIRGDGTEVAHVQLIVDPSAVRPASSAEETITLAPGGDQGYSVRSATVGPLRDQPPGPHITQVKAASRDASTVLVTFDSDLASASVARAISIRTTDGSPVASTTSYNPDTRTATVTVSNGAAHGLQLLVGSALTDIDGQTLAVPFTTLLRG
ncbi:MAG: Ig-like domain-containing protein [Candidatus Dormibacteria bacterium]